MADETTSPLVAAIRDHLELRARNSALEREMPLANYMSWPTPDSSIRDVLPADEAITEEFATSVP
jgi:hypothetical protein